MASPMVVGADIGFGNLKVVYGRSKEQVVERILPAGAVPIALAPRSIDMQVNLLRGHQVDIGDVDREELWLAGVPWSELTEGSRVLHEDYPNTKEYWALFMAALLETKTDHIELLVTGLPVAQYARDPDVRNRLAAKLTGVHRPSKDRIVTVAAVKVTQQAIGAYVHAAYTDKTVNDLKEAHTLVFDAGFYSVDYVVLYRNQIPPGLSSSSMSATSEILQEAAAQMSRHYGARVTTEGLEDALRNRKTTVMVFNKLQPFEQFVTAAARHSGTRVINQIRNQLRNTNFDIGCVILTGGAGDLYEAVIREAFPDAHLYKSPEPVLANARGFFRTGLRQVSAAAAARNG